MLVARQRLPQAPSHKRGVLDESAKLPLAGRYHRALADAEMAASLMTHLGSELLGNYKISDVSPELLRKLKNPQRTGWTRA